MHPWEGDDVICAYWWGPGLGSPHPSVVTMQTANLLCAIDSTRSHNVLRAELDSHVDTYIVGRHVLLIHEHIKVVIVSG